MLSSVGNDGKFELMFHLIDIVLCPFLAFRLKFLELIEFNLILAGKDEFLLDIIFLSKSIKP